MPRALTMQRSIVPLGDRKKFLERLRARRQYFTGANCQFWAFEESDLPGAYVEFIEASDERTLAAAVSGAPEHLIEAVRIYHEVELK
ncbi:MAG TPA: hypothetical protein VFW98_04465 [Gemmatimonadaceae bacterium]|nr:hypothetical protein [Gemmatimonadaceae bacterium]